MGLVRRMAERVARSSVVLSYGATGYALRRSSWDPADLAVDMSEKVAVVTGASTGIGFATARALALRGAHVVMVSRDRSRGDAARDAVRAAGGTGKVELMLADLGELAEVRRLADELRARLPRLDRLILNAGVLLDEHASTSDGLERAFATNVVAGFGLVTDLRALLANTAGARVLHVSSGGMYTQRLDLEVLQGRVTPYDGVVAYAQTKRAQVILNELWAEELADDGIISHAMHPGWADTPGIARSLPRFRRMLRPLLRDAEQGADTLVWLAVAQRPGEDSGGFWLDRAPQPTHAMRRTQSPATDRQALWELCTRIWRDPTGRGGI
jgi:NAD(P)-dependent dehydrogenase (short-subunit alcohol dehydrogenase family)